MIVLMIGDVVGGAGCDYVRAKLPILKKRYGVNVTVANGENSAEGNGMTPKSLRDLMDSGVDVITSGNHSLRRREVCEELDKGGGVVRPANYHPSAPGSGIFLYDYPGAPLCVINLQGIVYMPSLQSPFDCADELLKTVKTPCILVDFHAEATAEKLCMGYWLDGRVSAVVGTHTHIPTADARILKGGTGYITDVGMCGGLNSVLGVKRDVAVEKMRTGLPVRFENEPEDIRLSGAVLDIDNATGRCRGIESIVML
ncbi:MAG: TIGR00282 family metallophosphoesterase [Oscillospiraceae bacterium]|jgi:metallophosphoesterase (TIGR00282 family)|nr:TIGR00282 family metallophosphoesterase [Oscillospiraceae bacterium]